MAGNHSVGEAVPRGGQRHQANVGREDTEARARGWGNQEVFPKGEVRANGARSARQPCVLAQAP